MIYFAEFEVDGEIESVHGIETDSASEAHDMAARLVEPLSKLSHRVYVLKGVTRGFPGGYTYDEEGIRNVEYAAKMLKD